MHDVSISCMCENNHLVYRHLPWSGKTSQKIGDRQTLKYTQTPYPRCEQRIACFVEVCLTCKEAGQHLSTLISQVVGVEIQVIHALVMAQGLKESC